MRDAADRETEAVRRNEDEQWAVDWYFTGSEWALPLFEAARQAILEAAGPGGSMTVQKTQIAFRIGPPGGCRPLQFAFLWLPRDGRRLPRAEGRPQRYLALTFGLGRREENPRIAAASEPYPGRFTHHMSLGAPSDLDETVRGWLREADAFAVEKQRGRK